MTQTCQWSLDHALPLDDGDDDDGEILGRCVDPLSSAYETLDTVESRPWTKSDLGWSLELPERSSS